VLVTGGLRKRLGHARPAGARWGLFVRLRGDWRAGQAREVRGVLADRDQRVRMADAGGEPIGFVAATLQRDSGGGGRFT
jgi:hypothetical protein